MPTPNPHPTTPQPPQSPPPPPFSTPHTPKNQHPTTYTTPPPPPPPQSNKKAYTPTTHPPQTIPTPPQPPTSAPPIHPPPTQPQSTPHPHILTPPILPLPTISKQHHPFPPLLLPPIHPHIMPSPPLLTYPISIPPSFYPPPPFPLAILNPHLPILLLYHLQPSHHTHLHDSPTTNKAPSTSVNHPRPFPHHPKPHTRIPSIFPFPPHSYNPNYYFLLPLLPHTTPRTTPSILSHLSLSPSYFTPRTHIIPHLFSKIYSPHPHPNPSLKQRPFSLLSSPKKASLFQSSSPIHPLHNPPLPTPSPLPPPHYNPPPHTLPPNHFHNPLCHAHFHPRAGAARPSA